MARDDYFRFYFSYEEYTDDLSESEFGRLIDLLINYSANGIVPEKMGNEANAFYKIKAGIDYDNYLKECRHKYGTSGQFHPNWKGGITPENQVGRSCKEYLSWRMSVFKRDNFTCQICGQHGGTLNAHHIEHWSTCPQKRFSIDNGITLCKYCHKKVHRRKL